MKLISDQMLRNQVMDERCIKGDPTAAEASSNICAANRGLVLILASVG